MRPARPTAALLGLLMLAACTSSGSSGPSASAGPRVPAESDFTAGTCASLAPDVIAIGKDIPRLGSGGDVDQEVKDSLRDAQDRIFAVAQAAEPEVKPALDDFVIKIGIVRVRADGNSYATSLGDLLTTAYDGVLAVCTGATPSPG
ncbi:MAG: hypothetical protein H7233_04820 [Pseudorhodobacter sp.]|nr:hypothetical protein [Frankiaceae bacterium]